MSWTEDVPGTQNRGIHSALADHGLALRSDFNVRLHDGCGMGHADVNKMLHASVLAASIALRPEARSTLRNSAAFDGLGCETPTSCTKVSAGVIFGGIGFAIQSVAENGLATCRKFPLRARPDQRLNLVAALQQLSDQRTTNVSRAARDEDAMGLRSHEVSRPEVIRG